MAVEYNFSGRDYTAELERLNALLTSELPELTDRNHSETSQVILRLLARECDQSNDYIDRTFREGFLTSLQFKQSAIDLGILVGYLPTLYSAATTTLQFSRTEGNTQIAIPQYTAFSRVDGLSYLTLSVATLYPDHDDITVEAMQGSFQSLTFHTNAWVNTDWSGRPRVNLGTGVVAATVVAWHGGTPIPWTQVDSFWRSAATDLHYWLELDGDDGTVWLVVGDGVQGSLPPAEDFFVQFIKTDGATGNCGIGTIYLMSGSPAYTVTNTVSATGGGPAENTNSIRRNIPRVVRTQRRGVVKEDYEALIGIIAGVADCQVLDRNDSAPSITLSHWGASEGGFPHRYLVIVCTPDGGGAMSTNLKNAIWAQCAAWGHLGAWQDRYLLWDALEVPLDVNVRIGLTVGYSEGSVASAVITAVQGVLSAENRLIGGTLAFADLYNGVIAVPGVSWCEFISPTQAVPVENGQILTAGTVTVTVGT